MMTYLPNIELVCSMLMQEEAQRKMLHPDKLDNNLMAMYHKTNMPQQLSERSVVCFVCGVKAHTSEMLDSHRSPLLASETPKVTKYPEHRFYGSRLVGVKMI